MDYLFSPSSVAFYPSDLMADYQAAGTLPEDVTPLTDEEVATFVRDVQPVDKVLGTEGGRPIWVDAPVPTDAQALSSAQAKRDNLLSIASLRISPLQDIVDGYGDSDATDEEVASLKAWKTYRAALSRVTAQAGWPRTVDWPAAPTA